MTDATILQIANGVIGLIGTALTGWIGYLIARLKSDQTSLAYDARQVEILNTLRAKKDRAKIRNATKANSRILKDVSTTTTATHELVNGGAVEQFRQYAIMARRLADLTHEPRDVLVAESAERRAIVQEENVARVKQADPVVPDPPRVEAGPG